MKYRLKVGELITEVDVIPSDDKANAHMTIGHRPYHVPYRIVSENCYHLMVDGKAMKVFVARGEEGKFVFINGLSFLVQDEEQRISRRRRRSSLEETPGEVTPPMPAVVVRILVQEGDHVKRGRGLVVVTAMKMETTLVAPTDGRVKKVNTSEGAKVAPGDILVEIEEEVEENG